MADLLQSGAASNIVPPDPQGGLKSLSSILGIQQQRQALVTGQATQAKEQAGATVAIQSANENQALARLLSDPVGNGIVDSEGNPTKNAQSIVMRVAPTTGSDAYEKVVSAAKSKVGLNSAVNNLRGEQRQTVVNALAGPAADPNATYDTLKASLNNVVESNRGTPNYEDYKTIADTTLQGLDHVTKKQKDAGQIIPVGQEAWRTGALNLARGGLGAPATVGAAGIATPQTATQDLGATIQPGIVKPALQGGGFTGAGPPIAKAVPPGITTNANQQLVRVAPGGGSVSVIPGQQPNANPNAAQAVAQRGQAEAVTGRVSQALAQANNTVQAQDALTRAKAILESPTSPKTGANFESFKTLRNTLSSLGIDTQGADDMNTLAKNLARFEAARATASGLGGTDAARELAHAGSPNTQIDNKAALAIVNQSLAAEKALASYAKVQSKSSDPQTLLKNEADFRNIPHLIEAHEYGMSRTKDEADSYLRSHGISREQMKSSRDAIKEFDSR